MEISENVLNGQRVYNKFTLSIYDITLFKIITDFVWNSPANNTLCTYKEQLPYNHLYVGVGSGELLDMCGFPYSPQKLYLMDLNEEHLKYAALRLKRHNPSSHIQNILSPYTDKVHKYGSLSLNYVLYCLPSTIEQKCETFEHLYNLINKDGVIFGFMILPETHNTNEITKNTLKIYNENDVYSNLSNSEIAFDEQLKKRFRRYRVEVTGNILKFVIYK